MRGEEPIAMNTFLKSFNLGRKELNKGDFYKAQETWEHLWKYGTEKERFNIRGMIQLSVGLIKFKMGQFDAGIYLLKKSIKNTSWVFQKKIFLMKMYLIHLKNLRRVL